MAGKADDYLVMSSSGRVGCVVGLPEEVVAMLFALFSRNPKNLRDTLQGMLDSGDLAAPPVPTFATSDRATRFHERMTIGYGHKSVADHASVHVFAEGVSTVSERDFMGARLMAATSKSTRYVDFGKATYWTPHEMPDRVLDTYDKHVTALLKDYTSLATMATMAIRAAMPMTSDWKESAYLGATEKRGFDAVRDLLPACINTSYGMSMSATGLRELLDKRQTGGNCEIAEIAREMRLVARSALPALIPQEVRPIPPGRFRPHSPIGPKLVEASKIRVTRMPDWNLVQHMFGVSPSTLATMWMEERGRHLPPDRSSEFIEYQMYVEMPFAIARDLGRHRMMTQLWSDPDPVSPFGRDPIMSDGGLASTIPQIGLLSAAHYEALQRARTRLDVMAPYLPQAAKPYVCPLATMVAGVWKVSLRELIHIVGLRTTPQGHPAYRRFVQAMVNSIRLADPIGGRALESVTNFENILVGRPT